MLSSSSSSSPIPMPSSSLSSSSSCCASSTAFSVPLRRPNSSTAASATTPALSTTSTSKDDRFRSTSTLTSQRRRLLNRKSSKPLGSSSARAGGDDSKNRTVSKSKYGLPLGTSSLGGVLHPDEILHMALLGFSLFVVGSVVVYRVAHDSGGGGGGSIGVPFSGTRAAAAAAGGGRGAYVGGDPAVDDNADAVPKSGSGPVNDALGIPALRSNPVLPPSSSWSSSSSSSRGVSGWLHDLLFGPPPPPKPSPESMDHIGDKSRVYYDLRREYDALLPPNDYARTYAFVSSLRQNEYGNMVDVSDMGYDTSNCPLYPPLNYPAAWPISDVLSNWPSDDVTPRPNIYRGLCVFDYETEFEKAENYRRAEVPFVVRDDPSFLRTAERWNTPGYMDRLMGPVPHRTEYSPNNHFMYWMSPKMMMGPRGNGGGNNNKNGRPNNNRRRRGPQIKEPEGWTPPTKLIRMTYQEWLHHANSTDDMLGPDHPHWYYRLIGCGEMGRCDKDSSEFLFDEIPNFQPRRPSSSSSSSSSVSSSSSLHAVDGVRERKRENFYIVDPDQQKGIHCRFGMKGVIAENHFDASRNTIVLLGGERRYILSHPNQCSKLALLPKGHPSARHSAVDWSKPDTWDEEQYPNFRDARVNEIVMQAGDALYLPTNWFHYIISLELNFQCNSRSGITLEYMQDIKDCGF